MVSGVDLFGNDFLDVASAEVSQCVQGCSELAQCAAFTYIWGRCWYKISDAGYRALPGAVSGRCSQPVGGRAPRTTTMAAVPSMPLFGTSVETASVVSVETNTNGVVSFPVGEEQPASQVVTGTGLASAQFSRAGSGAGVHEDKKDEGEEDDDASGSGSSF